MPPKKNNNASYRDVQELIQMAEEQLKTKEEIVTSFLKNKDIEMSNVEKLYEKYPDDTFEGVTDEEEIAAAFEVIAGEHTAEYLNDQEADREESRYDLMKDLILDLLKDWKEIISDRAEVADIKNEFTKALEEQEAYITSDEFDRDKDKYADELRDRIAELRAGMLNDDWTDYAAKKDIAKYTREVQVITQRYSLEYLYERLDNPDTKDKEPERIMELFFNKRRSAYIMDRYRNKCGQLGLPYDAVHRLVGIEEKFLEPEFHVYNNFFLFFVTTQIAYADVVAPREVKQPMQNMISLVYNKFSSDAARETFLDSIRGFLQRFADYRDVFFEKNITHPQHPHRLEKEAERRATYRTKLIHQITAESPFFVECDQLDKLSIEDLESMYESIKNTQENLEESAMSVSADTVAWLNIVRYVKIMVSLNLPEYNPHLELEIKTKDRESSMMCADNAGIISLMLRSYCELPADFSVTIGKLHNDDAIPSKFEKLDYAGNNSLQPGDILVGPGDAVIVDRIVDSDQVFVYAMSSGWAIKHCAATYTNREDWEVVWRLKDESLTTVTVNTSDLGEQQETTDTGYAAAGVNVGRGMTHPIIIGADMASPNTSDMS